MSAFKYLKFVMGLVLVAIMGAVVNEFVDPMLSTASSQSTTQASATGVEWFTQAWTWMTLILLLLLIFMLLVGIYTRRARVGGI